MQEKMALVPYPVRDVLC